MDARLAQLPFSVYAREQLLARLTRLEEEWAHCAEQSDAESVHDLRVAIRRLGEPLRLFKGLFRKRQRKQVRAELKLNLSLAARMRDADIAREMFALANIALSPELALHLSNERAIAEAALRASLAAGMGSGFGKRWRETLRLHDASVGFSDMSGSTSLRKPSGKRRDLWRATETTAANVRRVLPRLLDQFCEAGERLEHGSSEPTTLHKLRLKGKHLRYALELFRPVYGRRMDDLIVHFKDTQTRLGDINDATATTEWLKDQGVHHTPEAQQLQVFLHHRAQTLSLRFLEYWRDRWGLPAFRRQWVCYLARYAGQAFPSTLNRSEPHRLITEAVVSQLDEPASERHGITREDSSA
jgi:CHAD domain-containing protein